MQVDDEAPLRGIQRQPKEPLQGLNHPHAPHTAVAVGRGHAKRPNCWYQFMPLSMVSRGSVSVKRRLASSVTNFSFSRKQRRHAHGVLDPD